MRVKILHSGAEEGGEVGGRIGSESGVRTMLDGSAILKEEDVIGAADGGEAMGNDNGGAANE